MPHVALRCEGMIELLRYMLPRHELLHAGGEEAIRHIDARAIGSCTYYLVASVEA